MTPQHPHSEFPERAGHSGHSHARRARGADSERGYGGYGAERGGSSEDGIGYTSGEFPGAYPTPYGGGSAASVGGVSDGSPSFNGRSWASPERTPTTAAAESWSPAGSDHDPYGQPHRRPRHGGGTAYRSRPVQAGEARGASAYSPHGHTRPSGASDSTPRTRHSRRILPPPQGPQARQIGPRPVRAALAAVSALLLLAGGVGYSTIGKLDGDLAEAKNLDLSKQPDGATDILLVGIDSRRDAHGHPLSQQEIDMLRAGDEQATNTDTMILIRVPNDGSSATAVSLPRDTYVSTPTMGNMKLNGVYGSAKTEKSNEMAAAGVTDENARDAASTEAGRKALISSVSDLTGITVDHYAEIGLLGFVLMTDAVGGVEVCLNQPVNEELSGAHFPAGRQTLNGPDALSFVRQRHGLPRGDLDRITRQQAYMASLTNHILSSKTLTDPSSLGRINSAVQRSVVLDSGWDVMGLASQMQNLTGGNVRFETIPVTSIDGVGDYGESIVTVDRNQVHRFFDRLLGGESSSTNAPSDSVEKIPDFAPGDYKVNVANAGSVPGLASRVSELAAAYGYKVGEVGNSVETGISESQVNARSAEDPAARALARQLGGLRVVEDPSLDAKELSVTLSGTYRGPGVTPGATGLPNPNDVPAAGGSAEPATTTSAAGARSAGPAGNLGASPAITLAAVTGPPSVWAAPSTAPSVVGTPGVDQDLGGVTSQPLTAGGDGPRCVN